MLQKKKKKKKTNKTATPVAWCLQRTEQPTCLNAWSDVIFSNQQKKAKGIRKNEGHKTAREERVKQTWGRQRNGRGKKKKRKKERRAKKKTDSARCRLFAEGSPVSTNFIGLRCENSGGRKSESKMLAQTKRQGCGLYRVRTSQTSEKGDITISVNQL